MKTLIAIVHSGPLTQASEGRLRGWLSLLIAIMLATALFVPLAFYFSSKREERNILILINYIPGHEDHRNYHQLKIFTNGKGELTTFDSNTLININDKAIAGKIDGYADALINSKFPETGYYVDMPRVEITVNNGKRRKITSFSVIPSSSPLQWIETLDYVKENMTPKQSADEVNKYFILLHELISCYDGSSIIKK